jgi:trehalose 6-phosphate synthase
VTNAGPIGRSAAGAAAHVVLVSDRGPIEFVARARTLEPRRRHGSVTALLDGVAGTLAAQTEWIAPSTSPQDQRAQQEGRFDQLKADLGYRPVTVHVQAERYRAYYDDAGVRAIWNIWHGVHDDIPVRCDPAAIAAYRLVNRHLADQAASTAAAGAVVAIQDYQLLLMPAMVRRARPDVAIVHFSHTPFPEPDTLALLPAALRLDLLTGMLGANVLGFQSRRWAHRFLQACHRWRLGTVDHQQACVERAGRRTWVRTYPVPVDVDSLRAAARQPAATGWAERVRADDSRRLILRVDRLDPAKNALRGFEAYGLLLHRQPDLAQRTRFVACLIPSRERIPAYRQYAEAVTKQIEHINGRFPGAITVHHGENRARALGIMGEYDVLLVNAVADGMNLVAQEGPVLNTRDGALILSSQTGASDLLPDAIALRHPRQVDETADLLAAALSASPLERARRARTMRASVESSNPRRWLGRQLTDASAARCGGRPTGVAARSVSPQPGAHPCHTRTGSAPYS